MQTTSSQKFRIGLIFIIVLFAFALVMTLEIRARQEARTGVFSVYTIYQTAYGLQAGYKVRYNGIIVGQIDAISILKDTAVRVDLSIDTAYRRFMRRDVHASIGSTGLMGDNLLDISPGTPSQPLLTAGSEIKSRQPVDYSRILKRVQNLGTRMAGIGPGINAIMAQFSSGKGSVGRLMNNQTLRSQLKSTVNTARKSISTIKKGTKGF